MTLEILDADRQTGAPLLERRQAGAGQSERDLDIPAYWVRPPQILSAASRACTASSGICITRRPTPSRRTYPIAAVYHDTPPSRPARVVPYRASTR